MGDAKPRRRTVKRVNRISDLPVRMRDVAIQLASGAKNSEAARALGIGVRTIDTHRIQALRRLGMRNNADLARAAIREGLVSMHDGATCCADCERGFPCSCSDEPTGHNGGFPMHDGGSA